jgi:hypothetical protein
MYMSEYGVMIDGQDQPGYSLPFWVSLSPNSPGVSYPANMRLQGTTWSQFFDFGIDTSGNLLLTSPQSPYPLAVVITPTGQLWAAGGVTTTNPTNLPTGQATPSSQLQKYLAWLRRKRRPR